LASAHLEYRGVENDEKSVYFHNKAIQGLARLIQKGAGANRNELLAAIMLLVYYEVVSFDRCSVRLCSMADSLVAGSKRSIQYR
jgi:hypothetical protein